MKTILAKLNNKFVIIADKVSFGMGTPTNFGFWVLAVTVWIILFATHTFNDDTQFLPHWFTSNAFNFPLNTVTTLAELYIGFLLAAAANRVQQASDKTLKNLEHMMRELDQLIRSMKEEEDQILKEAKLPHA